MVKKTKLMRVSNKLAIKIEQTAKKNDISIREASDKLAKSLNKLNGRKIKLSDDIQF